jgi:hypothetical protein
MYFPVISLKSQPSWSKSFDDLVTFSPFLNLGYKRILTEQRQGCLVGRCQWDPQSTSRLLDIRWLAPTVR